MPRPYLEDATTDVVQVCKAMINWANVHKKVLGLELGSDFDVAKESEKHADHLNTKEDLWVGEQKQDKQVTLSRKTSIKELRSFAKGLLSSVKRRTRKHPDQESLLLDFRISNLSTIHSLRDAIKTLQHLKAAIHTHQDILKSDNDQTQNWLQSTEDFEQHFQTLSQKQALEKVESSKAHSERDTAKIETVEFIEDMQLVAEAVEHKHPEALADLLALFDAIIPPTPTRKQGDE